MENELDLGSLISSSGICSCGREHLLSTKHILSGPSAITQTGAVALASGLKGRALLVADENTWEAAGPQVEASLRGSKYDTQRFVFPKGELHMDEHTVGSILMQVEDGTGFLVAVGSGTINDSCRFVAKRTGLPYIVVGTAPSMDGYASAVTPAVRGGFKITFQGVAPLAIIGDTDILKNAPLNMMAAGFGDVFGKITARLDWLLGNRLLGEYRCEQIAGMMEKAVAECMAAAPGLKSRDEGSVERLMMGLVLAGIAMQLAGSSRPASGAEHQISHFFEMRDLQRGRKVTLHGDKVGVAALMMVRMYEKLFAGECPVSFDGAPTRQEQESAMRRDLGGFAELLIAENCSSDYYRQETKQKVLEGLAREWAYFRKLTAGFPGIRAAGEDAIKCIGGPVRPAELGYSREDTRLAIKYAMEMRDRLTALRLAELSGRLDGLAEELADEFC